MISRKQLESFAKEVDTVTHSDLSTPEEKAQKVSNGIQWLYAHEPRLVDILALCAAEREALINVIIEAIDKGDHMAQKYWITRLTQWDLSEYYEYEDPDRYDDDGNLLPPLPPLPPPEWGPLFARVWQCGHPAENDEQVPDYHALAHDFDHDREYHGIILAVLAYVALAVTLRRLPPAPRKKGGKRTVPAADEVVFTAKAKHYFVRAKGKRWMEQPNENDDKHYRWTMKCRGPETALAYFLMCVYHPDDSAVPRGQVQLDSSLANALEKVFGTRELVDKSRPYKQKTRTKWRTDIDRFFAENEYSLPTPPAGTTPTESDQNEEDPWAKLRALYSSPSS